MKSLTKYSLIICTLGHHAYAVGKRHEPWKRTCGLVLCLAEIYKKTSLTQCHCASGVFLQGRYGWAIPRELLLLEYSEQFAIHLVDIFICKFIPIASARQRFFIIFFFLSLTFRGGQITRLLIALIKIAFFAYISLLFILVYYCISLLFFCLWYVRIFFSSSPYIFLFLPVYPSLPARISLLLCLYVFPHCLSLYLFVFLSIYEFTLKSRQADL